MPDLSLKSLYLILKTMNSCVEHDTIIFRFELVHLAASVVKKLLSTSWQWGGLSERSCEKNMRTDN